MKSRWKKGQSGNPKGRAPDPLTTGLKVIAHQDLRELATLIVSEDFTKLKAFARQEKGHALKYALANVFVKAARRGDAYSLDKFLDRLVGKVKETVVIEQPQRPLEARVLTFEEFCVNAGYPKPFPKQVEMMHFAFEEEVARLLLGARGVGKTDYVTICGAAYKIYLDRTWTILLITKSTERNAAIIDEISKAARANGVTFEQENKSLLRATGLHGKDHSVSSVTVGTSSIRGRHPKQVLMDDPVTEEDSSPATRKRVKSVYNEVSKLCKNVLIIGQPVHKFDLYEELRPLLKKMEVPHGSIPELDHDLEAMQLAGVSLESISASYHLKVISQSASPFESIQYVDEFAAAEGSVMFIDPSFKGGDFTAASSIRGHFDGVVVKGKIWKRAWNHALPELIAEIKANNVKKICFECNSLGDMPLIVLRQALKDAGIVNVSVVGKDSTNNKHSRIMNAGMYVKQIRLVKAGPKEHESRAYNEQVVKYEFGAENDDAPDSLASGLEWIGLIKGKKV